MAKPALVLVDLQNDFFAVGSNKVGSYQKAFCIPAAVELASHARQDGWKVVHVVTVHEGKNTLPAHLRQKGMEPYCLDGEVGAEILKVQDLYVEGDSVVRKRGFNGFRGTQLEREIAGHDAIVIGGVSVDCCVYLTAFEAANHGAVYLPFQAVSASSEELYVFGLIGLAKSAGVVCDAKSILGSEGLRGAISESADSQYRAWYRRMQGVLNRFLEGRDPGLIDIVELVDHLSE